LTDFRGLLKPGYFVTSFDFEHSLISFNY